LVACGKRKLFCQPPKKKNLPQPGQEYSGRKKMKDDLLDQDLLDGSNCVRKQRSLYGHICGRWIISRWSGDTSQSFHFVISLLWSSRLAHPSSFHEIKDWSAVETRTLFFLGPKNLAPKIFFSQEMFYPKRKKKNANKGHSWSSSWWKPFFVFNHLLVLYSPNQRPRVEVYCPWSVSLVIL
jgi:hypothetical protein